MKTKIIFAIAALCSLAVLMSGCHSKQAQITIPEDDAGYLADVSGGDDFFELLPGIYPVEVKKGTLHVSIPLKIKKGKRNPDYIVEELDLYPKDAEDNYVRIEERDVVFHACNKESAYQDLCAAAIGDIVNVDFQYTPANKEAMNAVLDAIASCEIDLSIEEPNDEDAPAHKSSTDWNKVLDSYEKYADQYIAVLKKVQAGDMNAYGELASLMVEYEKFASQLENAGNDLTPAQSARFIKISNKIANAAL